MCGIVGYIGNSPAQPVLLDGLTRLEYRGYDSAGIAVMDHGRIRLAKSKGRLEQLAEQLRAAPLPGTSGIGHTRWATHGEPSDLNAHPHTDMKGGIAVVHNGIIENHHRLRCMLQDRGCIFVSETDTEVIAHLLNVLWDGSLLSTVQRCVCMLEGSYALAVMCSTEPDVLLCTRRDSPLVIGYGECDLYLASDIPALLPYTREIELLKDREIAVLRRNGATIYDACGVPRANSPIHVDWDASSAEKDGYAHFMLKEIHEEPDAMQKTFTLHTDAASRAIRPGAIPLSDDLARSAARLTIAACGTACHAGMLGRHLIEHLARLPVNVEVASEFRYRDPIIGPGDLFLAISQSGETADTLAAMREAQRRGAHVLAMTNVVGSTIAREAGEHVMYTCAGPEIAVASTKAYLTQLVLLALLAVEFGLRRGTLSAERGDELLSAMAELPAQAELALALEERISRFASSHHDRRQVFFIGRGADHALAMEASLKLKEVSYIMSEAYAAGELKHGTIALIEEGTLVCAVITQPGLAAKTFSNMREVRTRGARVLAICTGSLLQQAQAEADEVWPIPDVPGELAPLIAIIPLQLLAYYMAVHRGCDVDKPRNLAKSVTVE